MVTMDQDHLKRFHTCVVQMPIWWKPLDYLAAVAFSEKASRNCIEINPITYSSYVLGVGAVHKLFEEEKHDLLRSIALDLFSIRKNRPVNFPLAMPTTK